MRKYIILIVGILLLAVNANAAFPVDEAGIAAYVRVGDTIEINKTIWAYEELVNVNKLDIIGKVKVPNVLLSGNVEYSHPLVYVGADGWIVAYYPKSEPASRIMQWTGYSKPYLNTTTLADAISVMTTTLGVNYESIKGNITYYDFRYPEANEIMMIVEYGNYNSFSLLMLKNFTLYNASFSNSVWCGTLKVDSTTVSDYCGGGGYGPHVLLHGFYSNDLFEVEKFHTVSMSSGGDSTVLIYRRDS